MRLSREYLEGNILWKETVKNIPVQSLALWEIRMLRGDLSSSEFVLKLGQKFVFLCDKKWNKAKHGAEISFKCLRLVVSLDTWKKETQIFCCRNILHVKHRTQIFSTDKSSKNINLLWQIHTTKIKYIKRWISIRESTETASGRIKVLNKSVNIFKIILRKKKAGVLKKQKTMKIDQEDLKMGKMNF